MRKQTNQCAQLLAKWNTLVNRVTSYEVVWPASVQRLSKEEAKCDRLQEIALAIDPQNVFRMSSLKREAALVCFKVQRIQEELKIINDDMHFYQKWLREDISKLELAVRTLEHQFDEKHPDNPNNPNPDHRNLNPHNTITPNHRFNPSVSNNPNLWTVMGRASYVRTLIGKSKRRLAELRSLFPEICSNNPSNPYTPNNPNNPNTMSNNLSSRSSGEDSNNPNDLNPNHTDNSREAFQRDLGIYDSSASSSDESTDESPESAEADQFQTQRAEIDNLIAQLSLTRDSVIPEKELDFIWQVAPYDVAIRDWSEDLLVQRFGVHYPLIMRSAEVYSKFNPNGPNYDPWYRGHNS